MNFNESEKYSKYIWINNKIIAWEEANIHIMTHSLHYGGSVFEGLRSYNGKIFKLMEHSARLIKSAELMHMKSPYSLEEINDATNKILLKNNLQNAYIRPLIWRGAESAQLYNDKLSTNLMILVKESKPFFKNSEKLTISPWKKISEDSMPAQSKMSGHYSILSLAQKMAKNDGFDDALLLDRYDDIAECTTTNIFFGKNKELITPIADRFLNGITRQTTIEMARNMGFKVKEKRITLDEIEQFNCCFKTGTAGEITGVSSISYDNKIIRFENQQLVEELQKEFAIIVGK